MRGNSRKSTGIAMIIIAIVMMSSSIGLADWYGLQPGPYQVGFRTIEQYDRTRTYRAKLDYFGNPLDGERSRPLQICIWYPAAKSDEAPMVYGEYDFPYPEESEFFDYISRLQGREVNFLHFVTQGNTGLVLDFNSLVMNAVRNAPEVEGKFPLLIYCPNIQGGYSDNALLCEYLASNGYIVATAPALGARDVNVMLNSGDLEAQIEDKQVVFAVMKQQPNVDLGKIGIFGAGVGGLQALLLPMRNSDIDAAVSLNGTFLDPAREAFVKSAPYFSFANLTRPFMNIYTDDREKPNLTLVDSLRYADRYNVELAMTSPIPCESYRVFLSSLPEMKSSVSDAELKGYSLLCDYVSNYFNAKLNKNDVSMKYLATAPPDQSAVISYTEGMDVPPTRAEFLTIIRQQGVPEAAKLYEQFRAEDPGNVLFDEATFNILGYQLMGQGDVPGALEIFRMNAEAYPNSCNVWDSYTDGLTAAGENDRALETIRKAMEVMPTDSAAGNDLKTAIREHARQLLGDEEFSKYQ
jgi:dienelactone hydrolase